MIANLTQLSTFTIGLYNFHKNFVPGTPNSPLYADLTPTSRWQDVLAFSRKDIRQQE